MHTPQVFYRHIAELDMNVAIFKTGCAFVDAKGSRMPQYVSLANLCLSIYFLKRTKKNLFSSYIQVSWNRWRVLLK